MFRLSLSACGKCTDALVLLYKPGRHDAFALLENIFNFILKEGYYALRCNEVS